jgi:hypothetical protein
MDEAPNTRPGWAPALAAAGVLLLVLAGLFSPIFSGESILHTEGRTVEEWDQHFAEGPWDSQAGLGAPRGSAPPGFTGWFRELCKLTPDPTANYANYYPPACLFLLGMAAWFCFRQLKCSGLICGMGALAAALNGVFLSHTVEFSGGLAVTGAALFVALAMIVRHRLQWPGALVAGLALGMGLLELGAAGLPLVGAIVVLALVLPPGDGDRFAQKRLACISLIPVAAAAVAWPIWSYSQLFEHSIGLRQAAAQESMDLLTLPIAGLFGHRLDVADNTQHWGNLIGSHSHAYAGVLVLLVAAWALAHAMRREQSFSRHDKTRALIFSAVVLVLPWVAWNSHWQALFSVCLLALFALGLKGLDEWHTTEAHEKTRAFGSGGFNSAWRIGSFGVLALATLGFTVYSNRSEELAAWILQKNPGALPTEAASLANASTFQAGLFVLFLFLSIGVLTGCSVVRWQRSSRTLGLLVLGLVLLLDLGRSSHPFLRFDQFDAPVIGEPMAKRLEEHTTRGRVALLNQYQLLNRHPLDHAVIDSILSPPSPDSVNWSNPRLAALARGYHDGMMRYRLAKDVDQFRQFILMLLSSPNAQAREQSLQQIQKFPGGKEFLSGGQDETLFNFFQESSGRRHSQLLAHDSIGAISRIYHEDWTRHLFPQHGIARARVTDFQPSAIGKLEQENHRADAIRLLIRQWQLASTRFFICHAGNAELTSMVREDSKSEGQPLPTYRNALNQTLDPVLRRFKQMGPFHLGSAAPTSGGVANPTNAPAVLMEFTGALPRAKLFADWRQGVDKKTADTILFSPGFDPHSQVILRANDLPQPEQPSQTSSLPAINFEEAAATRVELKIPPIDYAAVLLLNDQFDAHWNVTLDGQPATLLRANNHARAVHLPASDQARAIVFQYQPPALPPASLPAMLIIGLVIAGLGARRGTSTNPEKNDEPDTVAKPDKA